MTKQTRHITCSDGHKMKILVYSPQGHEVARKATGVLWIHGGGYFTGMASMAGLMGRAPSLVKKFGAVVVSPEYRLEAGCSTVQTGNLFCRSFDFGDKGQQMVIVRTYPDEGYASLSTSSFAFIGLGDEWHPVSGMDGMTALATTYIPMDGINEKGLCVADLIELDGDTTDFDSDKPDLTIVGAIRLVLDYAADVEEAIELLGQYDVHNSIGRHHHLAIADRRRSVVVEWKEGEMHVTDTPIVTNHCMWEERTHPLNEESKRRLTRLTDLYDVQRDDVRCTKESALAFLQEAAYEEWTIWSLIYDRDSLSGTWFIRRAWQKPYTISL